MRSLSTLPVRLILGLLAAVLLDTSVQLFWKTAIETLPSDIGFSLGLVREPLFLVVLTLMTAQFLNWIKVLGQADLSFAKPITALSFVNVLVFSAIFLKEHVTTLQTLGVLLVLSGVWFISQSDHVTSAEDEAAR
jgi:drug/metabolite transporter (DMT)-like permease